MQQSAAVAPGAGPGVALPFDDDPSDPGPPEENDFSPPTAPVARGSAPQSSGLTPGGATEPQVKAIFAIGRGKGMEPDAVKALAVETFQRTIDQLTRTQASSFIDTLKSR